MGRGVEWHNILFVKELCCLRDANGEGLGDAGVIVAPR